MSYAHRVSASNRARKWRLFQEIISPQPQWRVLDVGFSDREYSPTDNYLEKYYPYPRQVTALGTDRPREFCQRYPDIKAMQYDGRKFPFPDKSFDLVWSNAVLEHVGNFERQKLFLQEIKRVGRRAFITTPNRNFPIEIHTRTPLLHFLPRPFFESYLKLTGRRWATGDYMHLLTRSRLEALLAAAGINEYRIIMNRWGGFVLDFVIIF